MTPSVPTRRFSVLALLRRLRPWLEQGPHRIHLCMARTAVAARTVNFLEHRGRSAEAEARPAILFGDKDREKPRFRERADDLGRIDAVEVESLPIFARKIGAEAELRLAGFGVAWRPGLGTRWWALRGRVSWWEMV